MRKRSVNITGKGKHIDKFRIKKSSTNNCNYNNC